MKLAESLELHTKKSTVGKDKKYKVVLTREADGVSTGALGTTNSRVVHRLDDKDEAERRSLAMPFTKVVTRVPEEDPRTRQRIRRKKARSNPDVD